MDERLVEAAQALLTGYDTALSRQWREEDRAWRQADLSWREREATFMYARLCWGAHAAAAVGVAAQCGHTVVLCCVVLLHITSSSQGARRKGGVSCAVLHCTSAQEPAELLAKGGHRAATPGERAGAVGSHRRAQQA